MKIEKQYLGKWRIQSMEVWEEEFIDLNGPGRLVIEDNGIGFLKFGAVEAEVDFRVESVGGIERLEFSFEGEDEGDPVSGRGWAVVAGPEMSGKIYFHMGESSDFTAKIG
ncbi:MAG: hypothetical protein U5R49_14560 [Deltaproteobacteria bacterium]|nr:hypothetical protein [Deltaproteobacteria bacterium]